MLLLFTQWHDYWLPSSKFYSYQFSFATHQLEMTFLKMQIISNIQFTLASNSLHLHRRIIAVHKNLFNEMHSNFYESHSLGGNACIIG